MNFFRQLWAIVWKDFIAEFRTKETIFSMCLFSFLILVIFSFTFGSSPKDDGLTAAGILWVAFIFSGLMGLGRSFSAERDRGTLKGLMLCPVRPWTIFLGKLIGVFVFTTLMEVMTIVLFAILYNASIVPYLLPLGIVIFLGTLGFTAAGTLFSALAATTKARDVLLSLLFFPISVPVIIASVKATELIFTGRPLSMAMPWLKILSAFDLIFLLLAYGTFEYILEE